MSSAQAAMPVQTMKKSTPWLFFFSMFFQIIGGTIAGSYLTYYMTSRMLIAATVMGMILLVSRIADLLIAVVSGVIVQKTMFKQGQYRFWLFYAPLAVSVGTTLCFLNPNFLPMGAKVVLVFVGYVGYGGGMSFLQLSQNGTLAKFAGPNMGNRIALSAKMIQGQQTGTILASLITMPIIMMLDRMGTDGYRALQIVYAIVGFAGQLILYFGAKDIDPFNPNFKAASSKAGVGQMIASTLKNPQLILVMLCDILRWGSMIFLMSLAIYYWLDIMKQPLMIGTAMTISSVLGIGCSFIAPGIVKKIGKKSSAIISGIFTSGGYLLLALFAMRGAYYYIAFSALGVIGGSLINVCGVNLYLDCGEYQLYKTGKDNRTFVMSVFGLGIKTGFILVSMVTAVVLNLVGYDATAANPIANPQQFLLYLGGIPAACQALIVLIMAFGYRITEDKAREYATANHARSQQAQGAAT